MSGTNSLSDEIGRLLLCLSQALFKVDEDPDINYVRLGLGEYVLELHQAEHLIPEKRIQLMSEVLYCTDRDHLSKNQFFEGVLSLKSSDEVRHWLHKVQHYLRSLHQKQNGKIQSHVISTKDRPTLKRDLPDERTHTYQNFLETAPTFEDNYPEMQSKRIKLNKKEWDFESFLFKILNNFYDSQNDMEIVDVSKDGKNITYITEERPREERSLIDDLKTILYTGDTSEIPVGTLLQLLERILNVFDYDDKTSMPKEMLDNIIYQIQDYPKFNNHIIYE